MVLMPMGDDNPFDPADALFHIAEIRDDQIYTQHIGIWESQPAVYNKHIPAAFVQGHIFPDFV